jgi:hypothetical protein
LFNGIKFYKQCPNLLVLLEKKAAVPFIGEAYSLNIPVVSFPEFTRADAQISYLLLGGNLGLEVKQNNFFYFVYLLKNMLCLELGLKKKLLRQEKKKVRKAFVRIKKNKVYLLVGSRAFNMSRSRFRFNVKLKLLKIKFQLVGKILLRNFKMNKHFFKKKSTLSFIEKLRRRNYTIKSRKNISFFYMFERRLLVVLGRLYLARITASGNLRFLIENGYISVDNEIVKSPLYLTPHRAIIRVIKTLPRRMSKVPKRFLTNNLKWLYYKRSRRAAKKKPWQIVSRRKAWYHPKTRGYKFKQRIFNRPAKGNGSAIKTAIRKQVGVRRLVEPIKKQYGKKKKKHPYLAGEIKRRTRRYRWLRHIKFFTPRYPVIFNKVPFLLPAIFKNEGRKSLCKLRWPIFLAKIKKVIRTGVVVSNKYSIARSCFLYKKSRLKVLGKRKYKEYQYAIAFKKAGLQVHIPFSRKKAIKGLIERNKFFGYRREQRKLKKKIGVAAKKSKCSFFFLSFRKKKYKRRSSKSSSRKFFTNI